MKKKSSTKKHNTLSAEKKAQRKEEVQKQKRKSIRKRVLIGAIAVVLLGGAATGTIVVYHDDAIMTHARTAMKSDHYRVSQAMMSYYLKRMYNTYLNYYSADTLKSSYGLDVTKPLQDQPHDEDQSWYDYLLSTTEKSVQDLLVLAEAADANGFSLTQEQKDDMEKELNAIDMSEYPDVVTKEDIRTCMEIQKKATYYNQQLQDSLENTEEEMDTYFQEHAKNYETCDYATFTFSYEAQSAQTGLYLTQEEAANYAKSLEACKDLSAFQSWVSNYYKQSDQELSQLEIQQAVEKTYQENIGYTEGSAISEWIFDENAAVGDSQIFQSESSNSFTICLLLTQPEREEAPTVNVRHILIRSDSYASDEEAKAQAEAIYQEWKNGAQTEDSFSELAEKYSEDTAEKGLYEDVYPGEMVTSFNDWCFDDARKPGDTGIVESSYGYHILYFIQKNDTPTWKVLVNKDLISQKHQDTITGYSDTYQIKVKEKNIKDLELIQ